MAFRPAEANLEAWVAAQVIPFCFDFQKNHSRISLLRSALQPGQRFVALRENRFRVAIDPSAALQCTSYDARSRVVK